MAGKETMHAGQDDRNVAEKAGNTIKSYGLAGAAIGILSFLIIGYGVTLFEIGGASAGVGYLTEKFGGSNKKR